MPKLPPKDYIASVEFPNSISLQPIGIVHSPYKERHGTPRQARLRAAPSDYQPVTASIELFAPHVPVIAVQDLQEFEHIWVISWLHLNQHWNPTVRIPRQPSLRRGTLATRAPHRPNPIGLSAVKLLRVNGLCLEVAGIDLLDQTPVLDIKPYIPYCDALPDSHCGYVQQLEFADQYEPDILGQPASQPFPKPRDPLTDGAED
ncbi:MAG: tRNA (N6-threonylcarbamoyladenosine(37)-N6)-methyltransferase TrmO [Cyanobacteriota bacterium]|nr:tRNA (N6-threonylcarbamoyladenosine(37)-N6)-methyltransferase TrmO [Cyanobacteriota bacterium]